MTASLEAPSWGYEGAMGPAHWAKLSPKYHACGEGKHQSPINLQPSTARRYTGNTAPTLDLQRWTATTGPVSAVHNGHALQVDMPANAASLRYANTTYTMQQWHIHTPSEHRIDGRHYAGEIHWVSKSAEGQLLVVGAFFDAADKATEPNFLTPITAQPQERTSNVKLDWSGVRALATPQDYWTYSGSLTTPPCTEGVTWIVLNEPLKLSSEQVRRLVDTNNFNARYTMPTAKL
ncbi:carbonic anhydrase [Syncephalis pseudoplumigaleata]|uniref:carbonic anhydrase n=1 Tax=Syncephalis pseudoplumigaleata TaxID=1712513 RepID=A0A4P9Z1L1_9FUNG|nr:carbonic anhydrase [Syncephalis pseudoplumigaleata]|eukprot:RKP26324.1 carbonic anhydrase [Syncephalis pseudoplumigaleata]